MVRDPRLGPELLPCWDHPDLAERREQPDPGHRAGGHQACRGWNCPEVNSCSGAIWTAAEIHIPWRAEMGWVVCMWTHSLFLGKILCNLAKNYVLYLVVRGHIWLSLLLKILHALVVHLRNLFSSYCSIKWDQVIVCQSFLQLTSAMTKSKLSGEH